VRLPPVSGEWIDRSREIEFVFEGRRLRGYAGDTIASALCAAGERTLGRSFKYHRRRGVLSAANHDANILVQDGARLNVRADVEPLRAGMDLRAVNTFGGLAADRAAFIDRLGRFLPVGFYYKAFHTKRLFPYWEWVFRQFTGLGRVDFATPHLRTPKRYSFCDVLVIGAGASGLAAALAAADSGADTVLADENPHPGGSALFQRGGDALDAAAAELLAEAARHPRLRLLTGTLAAGYYADHWVALVDAQRMTKMRAKAVVVACGGFEQPAVFRNNDLPGVMLGSAAQRLIYRHAVQPMRRAVLVAGTDEAYATARDLLAHGVELAAVCDLRAAPGASASPPAADLAARGVRLLAATAVLEARAGGDGTCAAALLCPVDADGRPDRARAERIACDGIVMSVGWAPAANLLYQAGTRMRHDESAQQFVPDVLPEGVFACGRVNGVHALADKITDGRRAGLLAARHAGFAPARAPAPAPTPTPGASHPWPIVEDRRGKNFVDFDEDIQLADLRNAAQEGFDNIELLKRFSTAGMGPSQGKHSNMNVLRVLTRHTGRSPGEVGTTTSRPMFHPVPMSHLAGRGFQPERVTPLHARHAARGAKFMLAGAWLRPEFYPVAGLARSAAIAAEVAAVRRSAGLIDVGTLGKIELRGPQAAELLERAYAGRYASMKPGSTRYALMLDEAGVVIDDGVVARLADDRFYFTTTTSNSALVYRELQRWNTIWRLDCVLANLTGHFAAVNLAGPRASALLAPLADCDLCAAAFPFLAVRRARVAGIPARLMRVGFVGEWGAEIHVGAEHAPALWDALLEAGAAHGLAPFGVEAQRVLRLEKGHLIVGQDTDGNTNPFEAGLDWAVKMDKPFFVGQRSLRILAAKPPRQRLVGFELDAELFGPPPQECHLVIDGDDIGGRVTSICHSEALGRHVGLAMVAPHLAAPGTRLAIRRSGGTEVAATVCPTPFYDPQGLRQKASAP
jgi:sarcosine oxidase subunit alpha